MEQQRQPNRKKDKDYKVYVIAKEIQNIREKCLGLLSQKMSIKSMVSVCLSFWTWLKVHRKGHSQELIWQSLFEKQCDGV